VARRAGGIGVTATADFCRKNLWDFLDISGNFLQNLAIAAHFSYNKRISV
jgi:hypothetical protein